MDQRPILVTGAAGFIGSHLVDHLLDQGDHVVGLDNFCNFYDPTIKRRNLTRAMANDRFELIEDDICNSTAVMDLFEKVRPSVVVHLAAMAGVRPSIENPLLYSRVNVDGTVNLLDASVAHETGGFLFASSSSVYGNNSKVPFAEADRVDHPISPYAATKKAGELIAHSYAHLHSLPLLCLRFFTVYGPRQRPDLAIGKFLRLMAAGEPIPIFGDGSTSRDYTFVDDIIQGILAAMNRVRTTPGFGIYNLGGNAPVSLRELIGIIESATGQKAQLEHLPQQPGDVERTWSDLTHSNADLGYQPTTPLQNGIAQQWQWLQSQH